MKKLILLPSILFLFSLATFASTALSPSMRGCPLSGYSRLIEVYTGAQLASALSGAQAGDQIRLAAGTYQGPFKIYRSGSSISRVTICGVKGVWPKITGGTFSINATYINVSGILFEGPNNLSNNMWIYKTNHTLVTYNEFRNGDYHAGISVQAAQNLEISHNFIHDNGIERIDHGIYFQMTGGSGNVIANNVIVNNMGRGISMHSNTGGAISDVTVVNNTIVRNGSTGLLFAVNAGTGNVIANNILADNGHIFDYKQMRVSLTSGSEIKNNIVWSPNSSLSGIELIDGSSGNVISGNLSLDPKFVTSYSDLHLKSDSPAIGLALPQYAVLKDADDKLRDSSPDAGAYEIIGSIVIAPVDPAPAPAPSKPKRGRK